jgi:uncharacterized protein
MNKDVIELKGKSPGPTSVILVGVHGNETCGIKAIEELLPTLKIEMGKLFIIYGNPKAIANNVRFIDVNLNRLFNSPKDKPAQNSEGYEYTRAEFIKKYLDKADYMLDIHASFTPESMPFIICEKRSNQIAKYLPASLVVNGFSKFQRGTDYYMDSLGRVGICLECGYLSDRKSTEVAKKGIIAFIKAVGNLKSDLSKNKQEILQLFDMYQTKTNCFKLTKKFSDFEMIQNSQLIGTDGDEEIRANRDSYILFARDRNKINEEAFLLAKKENSPA